MRCYGNITYVNDSWVKFAEENGDPQTLSTGIGVNYLGVCRMAAREDPSLREMVAAIERVTRGDTPQYNLEYPCHSPEKKRWFHLGARPLAGASGGAVFLHVDITQRKLAEETVNHLNQALEKKVEERTSSLQSANQELEKALSEIRLLKERLERENLALHESIKIDLAYPGIVGDSDAIHAVFLQVRQVGPTDAPVLIMGETGTGKGLIAKAIHELSPRQNRPFITVNCASLPASLIESELFGHEKGAYTSAYTKRIGRFELADGSSLFLDEIGDLPLELQAKLLRVLQENEFERVGSSKTIKGNVRVIAATNRNVRAAIEGGRFREDLWYRLNVFPITIPPLRERTEDIPALATHFLSMYNRRLGKQIEIIPPAALEQLKAYDWPGNVRELENVIHRALIISRGRELELDAPKRPGSERPDNRNNLEDVARQHILNVLQSCNGQIEGKAGAAKRLGINPSTLRSRMKKLGIQKPG